MPGKTPLASPPRCGVIGAGRRRHGLGPFVCAHLQALGADVVAIAGRSAESAAAALADVQRLAGFAPQAFASVPEMFAQANLDAVVICSPDAAHAEHLHQARNAGVHALCEKPLVFDGERNPADTARPLVEGFAAAGRVLMANEQWPYTLAAFDQLYPGVRHPGVPPRSFQMLLCPGVTGAEMIPNSLPHPLSLLLAMHGGRGSASRVSVRPVTRQDERGAVVEFVFESEGAAPLEVARRTEVRVDLHYAPHPPRPAAYALDGHAVNRLIAEPNYEMFLQTLPNGEDLAQRVLDPADSSTHQETSCPRAPLPDPLRQLLGDFLQHCRSENQPAPNYAALASLAALWEIYQVAKASL